MLFKSRWWQHLIFLGIVLAILSNIFKTSSSYEKIDHIYTLYRKHFVADYPVKTLQELVHAAEDGADDHQSPAALQSQINPHFLLNSLQTIYALSLEKSERTPSVILQLSDILKYTLYETEHSRVKLEKEIGMIKDYVEMYRHRVDPVRAEIQLKLEGDSGDKEIVPMLLTPFIENSFQHGLQGGPGGAFVHIFIRIGSGNLEFRIENSMGRTDPVNLDKRKGIGIDNTKQRLKLLYPGKHQLSIGQEEGTFKVKLLIKLKD